MPLKYEICGDEAWTHGGPPLNRYWCFFGGLLSLEPEADRLETEISRELQKRHFRQEIKWSYLSWQNINLYKALVELLCSHLKNREMRFRQVFLDRSFVHMPSHDEPARTDLDLQFLICYQFLKHSFGLQHLPRAVGSYDQVFVRLDTHSSQKHIDQLREHVEKLPLAGC